MQGMRLTRSFVVGLTTALALAPAVATAQSPKGWVGIVITTGIGTVAESGKMVFNDYPTIESIDPGSPAEKAGLQAGDVLITINSQDFRKDPIPMASLLVPGQKIVFRYRRNDAAKTVAMKVVERPSENRSYVDVRIIGPAPSQVEALRRTRAEESLLNRNVVVEAPRRPIVSIAPLVIGAGAPTLNIVGAELTQLSADLRDALKVKSDGLFVIKVAMGTPAGEAGLKAGDVIFKAGDELIQNPGELIRLMRGSIDNSVVLRILRKQKPQTLTLRW
jgi:serine protease Do